MQYLRPQIRRTLIATGAAAFAAAASAALLVITLPPARMSLLAWFALVPLLLLRHRTRAGALFALAFFALAPAAWSVAQFTLAHYGAQTQPLIARIAMMASIAGAFVFALLLTWAAWIERYFEDSFLRIAIVPAMAAAGDALLQWMLRGVAVPSLAWSQGANDLVAQSFHVFRSFAPITFTLVLVNVGLADSLEWMFRSSTRGRTRSRVLASVGFVVAIVAANATYGLYRMTAATPHVEASDGTAADGNDAVHADRATAPTDQAAVQ